MSLYTPIYPKNLLKLNDFYYCLYPSNYPTFYLLKSQKTIVLYNGGSFDGLPIENRVNQTLIFTLKSPNTTDFDFTLNAIRYKNSNVIDAPNTFLKTSNYTDWKNSIISMFRNNKVLEDYDLYFGYNNFITIGSLPDVYGTFNLEAKDKGANVKFSTNLKFIPADESAISDNYSNIILNDYNSSLWDILLTKFHSFGDSVSEDVSNYEIVLDIYKEDYFFNGSNPIKETKLISTLSKKRFDLADFDVSSVLNNSIDKWTPTINDFNINVNKYIDRFKLSAYQKFVDKSIDPNNNYLNQYGDYSESILYSLESRVQNFDYYDPSKYNRRLTNDTSGTILENFNDSISQLNLETFNNSTSGVYFNNLAFQDFYYDRNLTKQPRTKILNSYYEILCNQVYAINAPDANLNDSAHFKFYYTNTTSGLTDTYELVLNSTEINKGKTFRYINQFCFDVRTLKNKVTFDWFQLEKFELYLQTENYRVDRNSGEEYNPTYVSKQVKYQTQTYIVNQALLNECEDNTQESETQTTLVFKNSMGGFDIFDFEIIEQFQSSRDIKTFTKPYDYTFSDTSEFEKIYDLTYQKQYLVKSRSLDEEEFTWLEDLIISKQVYFLNVNSQKLYPIILNQVDYGATKGSDKVISFTFNYSRTFNS